MCVVISNTVFDSRHQVRRQGAVESRAVGPTARSSFHRENYGGSLRGVRIIFSRKEGEGLLKQSRCRFLEIDCHIWLYAVFKKESKTKTLQEKLKQNRNYLWM